MTADGEVIDDAADLAQLVSRERVEHVLAAIERYGQAGVPVKGLIFCSRNREAELLSALLNARTLRGRQLRTRALSGSDSIAEREAAVKALEDGDLDYLVTVDIFNEGIDIPRINQVVMLRQTQSSIIFTQQLGRGLRKAAGNDYLVVIDFIGNYANNFLIPVALFGDTSLSKDSLRRNLIEADEAGSIEGPRASTSTGSPGSGCSRPSRWRGSIRWQRSRRPMSRWPTASAASRSLRLRSIRHRRPRGVGHQGEELLVPAGQVWQGPAPPSATHVRLLNLASIELLNGKRPHELVAPGLDR